MTKEKKGKADAGDQTSSKQIFVLITGSLWFEKNFIKFLTSLRLSCSITTRKYGSDTWILMKRLPFSRVPKIFHYKRKKGRGDARDQTTSKQIFVLITGSLWFEKDFIKFLTPWQLSCSITTRKYGLDNWILMNRLPFSLVPRIFHDKRKK